MKRTSTNGCAIPTLRSYVEALGFSRCHHCEHATVVEARRAIIVAMRAQGMSFREIALRLAARFDMSPALVNHEYLAATRSA